MEVKQTKKMRLCLLNEGYVNNPGKLNGDRQVSIEHLIATLPIQKC